MQFSADILSFFEGMNDLAFTNNKNKWTLLQDREILWMFWDEIQKSTFISGSPCSWCISI